MKLRQKRAFDFWVGMPLLMAFNLWVPLFRKLFPPKPVTSMKGILILKFQGIGSLLLARPSIHRLRAANPSAKILFWGTPATASLARLWPEVDEVIVLNDSGLIPAFSSLLKNFCRLWNDRVDWAFDLEAYSKLSTILLSLSGARRKVGFIIDNVRFRRGILSHMVFFNPFVYLGRAYEEILSLAGPLASPTADRLPWKSSSSRALLAGKYVVINPNCGPLSLERRWPREHFAELIERLGASGTHMVLVGQGMEEEAEVEALMRATRVGPLLTNLAGKISLEQWIGVLGRASLVVTGDTAALHVAMAEKVPVVALFGPTQPSNFVSPDARQVRLIYRGIYCSPCVHHWDPPPCNGDNQCMKRITAGEVHAACLAFLAPSRPRPTSHALLELSS